MHEKKTLPKLIQDAIDRGATTVEDPQVDRRPSTEDSRGERPLTGALLKRPGEFRITRSAPSTMSFARSMKRLGRSRQSCWPRLPHAEPPEPARFTSLARPLATLGSTRPATGGLERILIGVVFGARRRDLWRHNRAQVG